MLVTDSKPDLLTMKTFVISLVALATMTGACFAVDCYSCAGYEGSDCADPFNGLNGSICITIGDYDSGRFVRSCSAVESCANTGCVTNAGAAGEKGSCNYCCEENLCNNRSIADGLADILHCYSCFYRSDSTAWSDTCLNPSNGNVTSFPCDGVCGVSTQTIRGAEFITRRGCFSATGPTPEQCVPGCDGSGKCTTCCADNLCNGGTGKPTMAPSTTSQGTTFKTKSTTVLSIAAGLYLTLR